MPRLLRYLSFWFARCWRAWPACVLLSSMLRMPLVRSVGGSPLLAAGIRLGWAQSPLTWAAVAALAGTPVDTLAGSTRLVSTPAEPIEAKVGRPLEIRFSIVDTPTEVQSYKIGGKLPPGLTIADLDEGIVTCREPILKGTPSKPGTYSLTITGCEQKYGLGRRVRERLVIRVVP